MNGSHEQYMHRCLQLAALGSGAVAPNPMVGAVLVHEGRIIGEGYHAKYGEAHAEVNCLNSVRPEDRPLIRQSTLYVSLEPCSHFGKTPPCADLIIREKIPQVIIGCLDPFEQASGRGMRKLEEAGVKVQYGMLEKECRDLNKRFFCFQLLHRPYIILKWAQTADGIIGSNNGERLMVTGVETNRLVHRWRSEEAGILVGTNTALADDPLLNNRLWNGPAPVRLVLDKELRLPLSLRMFSGSQPVVVFNFHRNDASGVVKYYQLDNSKPVLPAMVEACYSLRIQSILVEGGAQLLSGFISEGLWDEARIIENKSMSAGAGVKAPVLKGEQLEQTEEISGDIIYHYRNKEAKQ